LRLSQSTWSKLSQNNRWKPSHLAWPNRHCDTLTSHYGNAVGRGDSQLVPSSAPHPPRRFSVRECARIMGFPNSYEFCPIRPGQGEMAHRKEGYRMIGNSVCPPLIASLAGSVLDTAGVNMGKDDDKNWTTKGRNVAVDLACSALRTSPVPLPVGCLVLQ
jgi:site-specific DNA-cytosine methylase